MLIVALYRPFGLAALLAVAGLAEGGENIVEAEIAAAERLTVAEAAFKTLEILVAVEIVCAAIAALLLRLPGKGVVQHGIVFGAFFRIFQRVIRLVEFAGFLVGIFIFAYIGVILAHQLAVDFFDVGQAGIAAHAEHFVIIFFRHKRFSKINGSAKLCAIKRL